MSKKNKKEACVKKCSIGGQALIEGIMMRGPKITAMAVRNPEGEMVIEKSETKTGPKVGKIPIVRGVVNFIFSMIVGYKCLMRSAEIAGLEDAVNEIEQEKQAKKAKKMSKKANKESAAQPSEGISPSTLESTSDGDLNDSDGKSEDKKDKKDKKEKKQSVFMTVLMIISSVLGIGFSLIFFIALPSYIYKWSVYFFPSLAPDNMVINSLVKSAFEGVFKVALLLAYMLLVTLMKDIRRTFQYHGAEHKTIFCYEHDKELTVENVRKERRFHPRCGTSFLILMLLVSIFVAFFIDPLFILISGSAPSTLVRTAIRFLLLPLTMGIGYELIKFAGKHDNILTRIISAPGVWLQHITVLEPTDDMIECAIAAFKEALPTEGDNKVCDNAEFLEDEKNET